MTLRTAPIASLLFLFFSAGCGGAATPGPVAPTPPPASLTPTEATSRGPEATPAKGEPRRSPEEMFASLASSRDDATVRPDPGPLGLDNWQRAAKVKGVGAPPASCAAYAKRAGAPAKDLPTALAESDAGKRDAMLVTLSAKDETLRVLRADLAPIECADAIVDPWLASQKNGVSGRAGHAAVGLSLASKLARTAGTPPVMTGARDKAKVLEFIKGPLKTWMVEQATAIDGLASAGAGLAQGYARGVAAVEAGSADLRLVDRIRSSPTPVGWDAELKHAYEAALDEALEPRKDRGRDAALVGLFDLQRMGSLHDARVERARGMLAKLYGGRRIDALDGLLLPKVDAPAPATTEGRALANVHVFWSERAAWLPADLAAQAPALARGVPEPMRAAFRAGQGPKEIRAAYARARLDVGRTSWRKIDFVEAAYAAKEEGDKLTYAVALTLAAGPVGDDRAEKNTVHMLHGLLASKDASGEPLAFAHTEPLDALADEGNGMAAYDAAYLRSLGARGSQGDAGAWFRDVAARFKKAESLLTDPAQKKLAAERATEAEATAAAADKK